MLFFRMLGCFVKKKNPHVEGNTAALKKKTRKLHTCHGNGLFLGTTSAICERACFDGITLSCSTHYNCNRESNKMHAIFKGP